MKWKRQHMEDPTASPSITSWAAMLVASLLFFGVLLAGVPNAFAQSSTATLGGRVSDQQDRVVPGAEVVVISEATGVTIKTQTNETGEWRVHSLVAGSYRFEVSAAGFATLKHSAVQLQIADQKFVDVTLRLGSTSETVVVQAVTPLIDTTAAVGGTVLTTSQLQELPSASNSPLELITLAPGVFQAPPAGGDNAYLWGNSSFSGNKINGSGSGTPAVNYLIDGASNSINSNGQAAYIPPMEAVAEVRVMTNAYDASIGRSSSGAVSLSMKSGTDKFHGSLYERNQNNTLNANYVQYNATGQPTPPKHYNEYGGTVGGPLQIPGVYDGRKKGTFFFFSYDGIRNIDPADTGFRSVPTALERQGDFSQSWTVVNGQRYSIIPYDPLTIDKKTGNRKAFPGAVIPADRISPTAKAIFNLLPLPNVPHTDQGTDADNYLLNDPRNDRMGSWAARVDHAWNNNHHSYVQWRYNSWKEVTEDPFGPDNVLRSRHYTRDNYGLTINHSWVVSPTVIVNAFINGTTWKSTQTSGSAGLDPTQYGFSQNLANLQTVKGLPKITGAMDLDVGTMVGPLYENDYTWETRGSVTNIRGNHSIQYGAEFQLQQESAGDRNAGTGSFDFTNKWTTPNPDKTAAPGQGSAFASFLLGMPSTGSMKNAATTFWNQPFMGFYVQDDWRVTPKLTLNLGMRWDAQLGLTERHDRYYGRFDPTMNLAPVTDYAQPLYAKLIGGAATSSGLALLQQYRPDASTFQALGGVLYAGKDGVSRALADPRYKYFQPRIGFAYQLRSGTVIRGGYGRFVQGTYIANHANQLGFSSSTPFTSQIDNYYTVANTLDNPFPNGLLPLTGNSQGILTNAGSTTSFFTAQVKRQYTDDVSLRVQQQVKDFLFEVAGLFEHTTGLLANHQIDVPGAEVWHAAYDPQFDASGRPVDTLPGDAQVANPFLGAPFITSTLVKATKISAYQLTRPNPLVNGMTETMYDGSSTNYALQAKAERRFRNGFGITTNFTWSKQMQATEYFTPATVSQKLHRVLSPDDRPFQYVVSPTYVLPFGRGKALGSHSNRLMDSLIGGWEISGMYRFYSGTPVKLPTNSAFFEGGDPAKGNKRSSSRWFNTDKFKPFPNRSTTVDQLAAYPAWTGVQSLPGYNWVPTSSSDATKNGVYHDFSTWISDNSTTFSSVRNPHLSKVDLGVRKNFRIHESVRLQLRIDAFNAFNTRQFGGPNTDPNNMYFGWLGGSPIPSQINAPRQIQLAGKLTF